MASNNPEPHDLGSKAVILELTGRQQTWLQACRRVCLDNSPATAANLADGSAWDNALAESDRKEIDSDLGVISRDQRTAHALRSLALGLGDQTPDPDQPADYEPLLHTADTACLHSIGPQDLTGLVDYVQSQTSNKAAGKPATPSQRRLALRVAATLTALQATNHPAVGYIGLTTAYIAGVLPAKTRATSVRVLLDSAGTGSVGWLTLTLLATGPQGLHPDPAAMAFFVSKDHQFTTSATHAWASSPASLTNACILWSVTLADDDAEIENNINGGSLGAAFAIAIHDLLGANPTRRWHLPRALRRRVYSPHTAVTAAVTDPIGELGGVGGLDHKLSAATQHGVSTVIVHPDNEAAARGIADNNAIALETARTVEEAIAHTRRTNPRFKFTAIVAAAVVTVLIAAGAVVTSRLNEAQALSASTALRQTAERVAQTAQELASGDIEGRAFLLAMAADDIGKRAALSLGTFDEIARDHALRSVIRPLEGSFERVRVSPDGRNALLATATGGVSMLRTASGETVWSDQHPPGVTLAPDQVYIQGLAFSDDSQTAAIGLSDERIRVIQLDGDRWRPLVTLAWSDSGTGPRQFSPIDGIAFSPDTKELAANVGGNGGVAFFDLTPFTVDTSQEGGDYRLWNPHHVCAGTDKGNIAFDGELVYVASGRQVVSIDRKCRKRTVAKAGDAELSDITLIEHRLQAVGTVSNTLVSLDAAGRLTTLDNRGPYDNVQVNKLASGKTTYKHSFVSATNAEGSFAYEVETKKRVMGLRANGPNSTGENGTVVISNGYAAVVGNGDTIGTTGVNFRHIYTRGVRWAGDRLVTIGLDDVTMSIPNSDLSNSTQQPLTKPEEGCINWDHLESSPDGRWVAATAVCPRRAERTAYVWDLTKAPAVPPQALPKIAAHIAFLSDTSIVTAAGRTVTPFSLQGWEWAEGRSEQMDQNVGALTADAERNTLAAALAESANGAPTLAKLDATSLKVTARKPLEGAAGLLRIESLSDGRLALAYGAGKLVIATPDLSDATRIEVEDSSFFTSMAELPLERELLVGARNTVNIVDLDQIVLKPKNSSLETLMPFFDVSPDGTKLAQGSNGNAGEVRVIDVAPANVRNRACRAINRDLTSGEWEEFIGSENVAQFEVCPGLPKRERPNSFRNEQKWVITTSGVGPYQIGMTAKDAAKRGLIIANDGNDQACAKWRQVGNWQDPASDGGDALYPQFTEEEPDSLYAVLIRGRPFYTAEGVGVGDTLSALREEHGDQVRLEPTRDGSTAAVLEDDKGIVVFTLNDREVIQQILIDRRTPGQPISTAYGC